MQIYLIENMDRSIYFITDTCEDLGDVANEHPEETWIVRPIKMKLLQQTLHPGKKHLQSHTSRFRHFP